MTQQNAVGCPHCGAMNPSTSTFCQSCGKALPSAIPSGPRVIEGQAIAATAVGQKLQADELIKQAKRASSILLTLGVIQLVLAGIVVALSQTTPNGSVLQVAGVIIGVIGVVFLGLGIWARFNPLPAAIVGLVLYCTFTAIDLISTISQIANAPSGAASGGFAGGSLGGIFVRIAIIAALCNAVSAGLQYRRLRQATAPAFPIQTNM